jgi:hypothetical protein
MSKRKKEKEDKYLISKGGDETNYGPHVNLVIMTPRKKKARKRYSKGEKR